MKYYTIVLLCIFFILGGCSQGDSSTQDEAAPQEQAAETSVPDEVETPESAEAADDDAAGDEASDDDASDDEADADADTEEAGDEEPESAAEEGTEDAEADTSASASALNSPLNSPLPTPPAIEVQTSSTGGAISGQLIAKSIDGVYVPLNGYIIGLATLVPREDGDGDLAAAYDPSNSPSTRTNEFGQFVFNEMEPGRYGLILDAVVNQALLSYPPDSEEGKGSILIELEAEQHFDLGTLQYDSLPVQGFAN